MKKGKLNITITVKTVPHPDPQRAIDVLANIIVKQLEKERGQVPKGVLT